MSVSQSSWLTPLHDTPRFPSEVSQPLYDSVTFLESTSPVKLPTRQCFAAGFLCGITIRVNVSKERCSIVRSRQSRDRPSYARQLKTPSQCQVAVKLHGV